MQIPGIDIEAVRQTPAKPLHKPAKKQRPPRKVCVGCSQMFYGYKDACKDCEKDAKPDREALASQVRERRMSAVEERMKRAHYNEFPDGY